MVHIYDQNIKEIICVDYAADNIHLQNIDTEFAISKLILTQTITPLHKEHWN